MHLTGAWRERSVLSADCLDLGRSHDPIRSLARLSVVAARQVGIYFIAGGALSAYIFVSFGLGIEPAFIRLIPRASVLRRKTRLGCNPIA